MFHESLKKQFNWNLMLRYTVKLTLNQYFMKYSEKKFHSVSFPLQNFFLILSIAKFLRALGEEYLQMDASENMFLKLRQIEIYL